MTKCVLKNENGVMIKSIDTANTKLELTTDPKEAFNYINGEWFAKSELEFLQFHYKEEYPDVTTMTVQWVSDTNDEDLKKVNDLAGQGAPIAEAPMEEQINEEVLVGDAAAPVEAVPMYDLWDDLRIEDADAAAPW
jgi:hypothetical protein